MMKKRIPLRLILSLIFAALALTLLTWGLTAPQRQTRHQVIRPEQMQLPDGQSVPETRLLTLDSPITIRNGEADRLRLTVEAQEKAAAVGSANVYKTYQVFAETRLEMTGLTVRPIGTVSEPVLPGQSVSFFWSVRPQETGRFDGTLWLYLRFVPKDGGPEIRQAISSQTVEIESTTFFGLQGETVREVGLIGVFCSAVLGFSYFVDLLRWMLRRKTAANKV